MYAGEWAVGRQLRAQLGERVAHAPRRDLRRQQPLGGAQADEILEAKLPGMPAAARVTEPGAHHGAYTRRRHAENTRHVTGPKTCNGNPTGVFEVGRRTLLTPIRQPPAGPRRLRYLVFVPVLRARRGAFLGARRLARRRGGGAAPAAAARALAWPPSWPSAPP